MHSIAGVSTGPIDNIKQETIKPPIDKNNSRRRDILGKKPRFRIVLTFLPPFEMDCPEVEIFVSSKATD
jgi:hypothetical protein